MKKAHLLESLDEEVNEWLVRQLPEERADQGEDQ